MKILILANNDMGLYKFRKELVQELLKYHIVYISAPTGKYIKNFIDMGCVFIDTKLTRHGTNPVKDLKLLSFYKKTINTIKPDIVLTYTIKPNVYGGIACKKAGIPYIANITGLGDSIENGGILSKISLFLYKKGIRNAKCIFFQNKKNLEFFLDKKIINSSNNYKVLPGSGVNLSENCFEKYPSDEQIRFVTIGRITKDKGIIELIEAARYIKNKYNGIEFVVVGPIEDNCDKDIKQAVDEHIINYLGERDDIHNVIKNSHATIHPSYHEGLSNVLLETAACGRPILASRINGCLETFNENDSGLSFVPKDVDSLIQCIETFISLPHETKVRMGLSGRKKIENEFDRVIILDAYCKEIDNSI